MISKKEFLKKYADSVTDAVLNELSFDYFTQTYPTTERLPKQDLELLYIKCNLPLTALMECFSSSKSRVWRTLDFYKIKKTKEQANQSKKKGTKRIYGVDNIAQLKETKEKVRQTFIKRYGVDNYSKTSEFKEQYKEIMQEKYGVDNYSQTSDYREKVKKTCLEKYGVENSSQSEEIKAKARKTNLEKYGVEYTLQSKEVRAKGIQTNLEKYGVENPAQTKEVQEKMQQTCLEKYGVKHYAQTEECQEKIKQTCLERYGREYYTQTNEFKARFKQTCLKKYGAENPLQNQELHRKAFESAKRNGSLGGTSNPEKEMFKKLQSKFPNTQWQYIDERYPFACDFYIPELDLFIEYQGFWSHGKHPYNPQSEEDNLKLATWNEKALKSYFYRNAITTWTVRDPLKREIAKQNNLNWIEFFIIEDFEKWFDTLT